MESNRQKKVAAIFKEELSEILRKEASENFRGYLLTVTEVRVTPDLSSAKVFVSIFPSQGKEEIMEKIIEKTPYYRSLLAKTAAKSMRITPEIYMRLDNSLEEMDKIDKALKGKGNNPTL